jgi:hypothetical protein
MRLFICESASSDDQKRTEEGEEEEKRDLLSHSKSDIGLWSHTWKCSGLSRRAIGVDRLYPIFSFSFILNSCHVTLFVCGCGLWAYSSKRKAFTSEKWKIFFRRCARERKTFLHERSRALDQLASVNNFWANLFLNADFTFH